MRPLLLVSCLLLALPALALPPPCNSGHVYEDVNGDGRFDAGDRPLPGVAVSDGWRIQRTDARGAYHLPVEDGRTVFVIKPAGYRFPAGADGLPAFWRHVQRQPGPDLKYGGIPAAFPDCRNFALQRDPRPAGRLRGIVMADPQPRDGIQAGHFERGIIAPLIAAYGAQGRASGADREGRAPATPAARADLIDLGLTLGDVVHDDLSLYPRIKAAMAQVGVPWLHLPGNHDLDFDADSDEDSLRSYRAAFGPDTYAWEEHEAVFVLLDDVIYRPGRSPSYIGGLREQQFAFLEAYLAAVPRDRLLVLAAHIPFFDEPDKARPSFRRGDRERLFALLKDFPRVLLLSAHGHVQRQYWHDADDGWQGATPLHEFNAGAACGAFWSGVAGADGVPVSTMADGTPRGWAELVVDADRYRLRWRPADPAETGGIGLHAPRVLRQGAYPAFGVYANVYDGHAGTRVEYRIGEGPWQPMQRVERPDPRLLVQNVLDDLADGLRSFDRSPEAVASTHLWRATLPTGLAEGEHRIEVRAFPDHGRELRAVSAYRLQAVSP
ncbi:calcineurin-like phosphoesterase C-terminal domain-containing protein [Arenimonas fontis]|nr:calcineurin-like phosphoesterase family protein [Arenimonas fontis]